ncbi:MAG: hypothetical protein M1429_03620 [Patescibacteria group bacterium]|nr:hypothetical protein [Patescibacteria group bacterium]
MHDFHLIFGDRAKLAIIGDCPRKYLIASAKGIILPDRRKHDHFDAIVILIDDQLSTFSEILKKFKANHGGELCYEGRYGDKRIEFIGVHRYGKFYTPHLVEIMNRPDLTIERFGYVSDHTLYDQSGQGFADFKAGLLRLMNPGLTIQKYLKIISLHFQTGFTFEAETEVTMKEFLDSFCFDRSAGSTDFDYNHNVFSSTLQYHSTDFFKIGIHIGLLYLRSYDPREITTFIENNLKLRELVRQADVDYRTFESQVLVSV